MNKFLSYLAVLIFAFTGMLHGQSMDDVISLFNNAAEKTNKGDFATAIKDFEELVVLAEKVGTEATDLKMKAQEQLSLLNWQIAAGFLKQRKFMEAIPSLEKVVEYSTEFNNNPNLKERAERLLPQVYTAIGTQKFREKDYAEALKTFDNALKYNEDYPTAYLGKGLAFAEMEDEKNMVANLEKAIALGKDKGDEKTAETASTRLARYYTDLGDMEMEAIDPEDPDFDFAIDFYNKALKYDNEFADANYKLAVIYNLKIDFDKAIEFSKLALASETDEIKIAAINLELGNAYFNTAQYDMACDALKKAMVGPIEEMAIRRKEKVPGCN